MDCPRCIEKMSSARYNGVKVAECLYCNGVWLPERTLVNVLARCEGAPSLPKIKEYFSSKHDSGANRSCPECADETLSQVLVAGVELDLCPKCGGMFFDGGELKQLLPSIEESNEGLGVAGAVAAESLIWVVVGFLRGG
ncbi:MAG: zf-TFIIB domain-containing protein [Chromatiaceae bacterium]|nr:zf-TFIIB domain-containing protein [Chromatiaceae bacterium]